MIALGSDHAGYCAKESLKNYFNENLEYKDFGNNSSDSCDYPLIAKKVAEAVSNGICGKGILICGSGIGMCIAANKIKNIRAAVCYDEEIAKLARLHNDINILCLGARIINFEKIKKVVDVFLNAPFESERHQRRINQIKKLEGEV